MNKLVQSLAIHTNQKSCGGVLLKLFHHHHNGRVQKNYDFQQFNFLSPNITRKYSSIVHINNNEEINDNDDDNDMGYSKLENQSRIIEKVSLSERLKQRALENQLSLEEAINISTKLISGKKSIVAMIGPVASTQSKLPKDIFEKATSQYYQQNNALTSHVYGDLHILYNIDNKATTNTPMTAEDNIHEAIQVEPQKPNSRRSMEALQLQDFKENTVDDLFNWAQYMSNPAPTLHYLQKLRNTFNKAYNKGTMIHDFLLKLKKENKLLRVYTENIDGLEQKMLGDDIVVNCLGILNGFHCDVCGKEFDFTSGLAQFPNKDSPDRNVRKGKCEMMSKKECGLLPNIILENDSFPKVVRENGERDISEQCDMIIVIGTPSSRQPLSGLMRMVSQNKNVSTLWILPMVLLEAYRDIDIPRPLQEFATHTSSRNNVIVLPDAVTIESFVSKIQAKLQE
ncbi:hypothetical protein C9374_003821 [Naegleria lovaniensis]|uniref:Deacetylase sirtuin-type domain-containing protein n=1 Tax=Naegleria lovaniensis TaxID=51637 RepID=A0AA88KSC7_NAELO|nr:uncharacterized protein C9374_003821 [Naegleria lovaniensis]KAG2394057.1 hypothetical protein C9374_003821 [Naegleria lovaniensis]